MDTFNTPMRSVTLDAYEWQALVLLLETVETDEALRFAAWIEREAGLL